MSGEHPYYVYVDHLNSPRAIADAHGKVVWRWDSDPFGAPVEREDPDGHSTAAEHHIDQDPDRDGQRFVYHLRFPGQYYDRETRLHYNLFRDYDPKIGRYLESDPIGLAGGLNTYAYVGNSPLKYTDPLGLDYLDNYLNFVNQYLVDPTPYALPLLIGAPIPKSWVGASPLLGSTNPLTSAARALGVPGAKSAICRTAVFPAIGVGLIGIGTYNSGILVNGLFRAADQ